MKSPAKKTAVENVTYLKIRKRRERLLTDPWAELPISPREMKIRNAFSLVTRAQKGSSERVRESAVLRKPPLPDLMRSGVTDPDIHLIGKGQRVDRKGFEILAKAECVLATLRPHVDINKPVARLISLGMNEHDLALT